MTEPVLSRRMDSFGKDDLTIPEAKLIQNVGGDLAKQQDAKPGDFFISMMGEVIPQAQGFDVILVDMQKTRTYWGTTYKKTSDSPQCSSLDAETFVSQNNDNCKECPYFNEAPWLLEATKRREMCLVNYNLLVFRAADELPLIIRTSGISTQAARSLLTSFKLNRKLAGQYHKVIVHVGSVEKTTPSGQAWAFVFTPTGRVTDEVLVESYRIQTASLLGVQFEALPQNEEPPTTQISETGHDLAAQNAVLAQQLNEKIERDRAAALATVPHPATQQKATQLSDAPAIRTASAPPAPPPQPKKKINTDF